MECVAEDPSSAVGKGRKSSWLAHNMMLVCKL